MRPEDVLEHARRRSAQHAGTTIPAGGLEVERADEPDDDQLLQWAVIEPDLREVRSTRRGPLGRAVTAVKQGQLRLMGQYHAQVTSTQSRVNVHLSLRSTLARDEVRSLRRDLLLMQRRVEELEARLAAGGTAPATGPGAAAPPLPGDETAGRSTDPPGTPEDDR
jgi:hypothetical protein